VFRATSASRLSRWLVACLIWGAEVWLVLETCELASLPCPTNHFRSCLETILLLICFFMLNLSRLCGIFRNIGSTVTWVVSGWEHLHPDFLGDIAICMSSLYYVIEYYRLHNYHVLYCGTYSLTVSCYSCFRFDFPMVKVIFRWWCLPGVLWYGYNVPKSSCWCCRCHLWSAVPTFDWDLSYITASLTWSFFFLSQVDPIYLVLHHVCVCVQMRFHFVYCLDVI
jgi:hypothetical protein